VFTTRPSNVRVCLFRHPDIEIYFYHNDYKGSSPARQENKQ
jgi:hypothetical protein